MSPARDHVSVAGSYTFTRVVAGNSFARAVVTKPPNTYSFPPTTAAAGSSISDGVAAPSRHSPRASKGRTNSATAAIVTGSRTASRIHGTRTAATHAPTSTTTTSAR